MPYEKATVADHVAKRDPEVRRELAHLNASTEKLIHFIDTLRERFSPLLRITPPQDTALKNAEEPLVPLAEEIRQTRLLVQACSHRIQEIIDCCEL